MHPDASSSPPDEQEHFIPQTHPLFTTATVQNPTFPSSTPAAAAVEATNVGDNDPVANFQVDLRPFLVACLAVEHGCNRPARGRMALGGEC
jgi:hypothetical protein